MKIPNRIQYPFIQVPINTILSSKSQKAFPVLGEHDSTKILLRFESKNCMITFDIEIVIKKSEKTYPII